MSNDGVKLHHVLAADGSLHFATIPDEFGMARLYDAVIRHPRFEPAGFVTDGVTQTILDFRYCGHHFTVDTQFGEFWLFVADRACPLDVQLDVTEKLLEFSQSG